MYSLNTRRPAAVVLALGVAIGGLTLPPAALAENGAVSGNVTTTVQHEALINLDTNARGTLTIEKHKRTDNNGTEAGNGLAVSGLETDASKEGGPLEGVTYKIERLVSTTKTGEEAVTYDLTTQAGWENLAKLNGTVPVVTETSGFTAVSVDPAKTENTQANGQAKFADLPLGAYIVTETKAPAGYTLSEPFIVTVPMTHPTELNKWNYDPIVYPKNSKTEVKKEVKDDAAPQLGDTRTYTITADIPNLTQGETLKYYQLVDQYDSRLSLDKNKIVLKMDDDTTLAATDYDLKYVDTPFEATSAADSNVKYQAKRVTAVLTEAGRAKILAARQAGTAKKVIMTLEMTVAEKIGDNGVIRNSGYVIPQDPGSGWDPEQPGTPPGPGDDEESKYGKVKITKVDNNGGKLEGAEFEVFRCVNNDTEGTAITLPDGKNFVPGDYKTVGDALKAFSVDANGNATAYGETRFKTAADGTVTIDALQNNDWENGKKDDTPDAYCLVEKKAPKGFELQTKPIAFQILESNSTADNTYTIGTEVTNVPSNGGFRLPMTGAAGVIFLLTMGGILILGGAALKLLTRRKKQS